MNRKILKKFSTKNTLGNPIYIVAAKRTPIGAFMGKLSKFKAPELGAIAIKESLKAINVDGSQVDEIIMGNVLSANIGQNPAKQASVGAGIPVNVPCTTINKVCSSGMKSVMFGAMNIGLGLSNLVVTGGFESMSNVPFYLPNMRKGMAFGNSQVIDGVASDGLTCVYNKIAMGLCAEKTVNDLDMDRAVQDEYCISSYERTINSIKNNKFRDQVVPVQISEKETLNEDEEYKKFIKEKIPLLRPVFSKNGTITAGNASKINDGACSIVLMSQEQLKINNVKPMARIVSFADAESDPIDFCIVPAKACQLALKRAGLNLPQIDYHEINEAFSATALANMKLLDIDIDRVNVNGGAVSLGHPVGMSGARIIQSLIYVLKENTAKYGMASICNGGGGASAIIIENL